MCWTYGALCLMVCVSRAAETPFTCSASFNCFTPCCYFLFIFINSGFYFSPTFPFLSTIFPGRINRHLLKLPKFSVSHLAQPECSGMWKTRTNSTSSRFQKKVPFISHQFNIKEKLKLGILVHNFFPDPFSFLVCINGMISWL